MIVIVRVQLPDEGGRDTIAELLNQVAEDSKTGPYSRATWEVPEQSATLNYSILEDADNEAWLPFAEQKPKK